MTIETLAMQIRKGDTAALARGITLVESSLARDWDEAKKLLELLGKTTNKAKRIGFSGPPGAGKSSFIEKLGLEIIKTNEKVAVLAVDPSSEISGGSILGDKTRMEELSRNDKAFIRPSANRGHLGGVTTSLPGAILLCEAAGYQWILIESVGVGQAEIDLHQMVDFFALIAQPGSGDELQGIKRGVLEYVDMVIVNKSDRVKALVNASKQQFLAALKILRPQGVTVETCSALTGDGIAAILKILTDFFSHYDFSNRKNMMVFWFESLIQSEFKKRLINAKEWVQALEDGRAKIKTGATTSIEAVDQFFKKIGLD